MVCVGWGVSGWGWGGEGGGDCFCKGGAQPVHACTAWAHGVLVGGHLSCIGRVLSLGWALGEGPLVVGHAARWW